MNTASHFRKTQNKTSAACTAGKCLSKLVGAGLLACSVSVAYAGAEFKINDDTSLTLGLGLRASYTSLENGAPSGNSNSNNFTVENARLYSGGSYGKYVKAT